MRNHGEDPLDRLHEAEPSLTYSSPYMKPTANADSESDELTLAYISIEIMKARIVALESELEKFRADSEKPHPASSGWSGDDSDGYNQGFRGHGY